MGEDQTFVGEGLTGREDETPCDPVERLHPDAGPHRQERVRLRAGKKSFSSGSAPTMNWGRSVR